MERSHLFIYLLSMLVISSCNLEGENSHKIHPKIPIEDVMETFIDCKQENKAPNMCKEFTARAINSYYGIGDFYSIEKNDTYMSYDNIYDYVTNSTNWKKLGSATNQGVLDMAQENANKGIATIAIETRDHKGVAVALIIEGKQKKSGSWGLNCPNAAYFFPTNPSQSFIGKTLNYVWEKPDGVYLFSKR